MSDDPLFSFYKQARNRLRRHKPESMLTHGVNALHEVYSGGINVLLEVAGIDRMPTKELLERLIEQETDGPWAIWWESDIRHGNIKGPAARLARILARFRIKARGIRVSDNSTPRGYLKVDFADAWERYCSLNISDDATVRNDATTQHGG
jgi:hypothetical protein